MNILILDKTPYENGKCSGEYFKKVVGKNCIKEYIGAYSGYRKDIDETLSVLKQCFPKYYEEVVGKANGLDIDLMEYFTILCPEITGIDLEHCTTVMYKNDSGDITISHNEDDDYIKGNLCFSKINIDENNWFITNDMFNMPFGNGVSLNSFGIIKTINYCHDENINVKHLPRYFLQRHISEANSIEDMIEKCKEMTTASGFHINAIDINKKEAASIEVYSDGIDVKYLNKYYIHTNHFIHGCHGQNPKTDIGSNSIFRLTKCHELLKAQHPISDILEYRSVEDSFEESILQTKDDPYRTLFNLSFCTKDNEIIIKNYIDNETVNIQITDCRKK